MGTLNTGARSLFGRDGLNTTRATAVTAAKIRTPARMPVKPILRSPAIAAYYIFYYSSVNNQSGELWKSIHRSHDYGDNRKMTMILMRFNHCNPE
jgi:hypothetical protein